MLKRRIVEIIGTAWLVVAMPGTTRAGATDLPTANFTSEDTDLMMRNVRAALDSSDPAAREQWSNPKTGASGFAQVKGQFTATDGVLCKRLFIRNVAKGSPGESTYTFCKVAGRGWVINEAAEPVASNRG